MSLEYILEDYPVTETLDDGTEIELRPLKKDDEDLMEALYLSVPECERAFIKHRLTDHAIFHEWCEHIDYEANLPLLAIQDGKAVAEGTLHQRQGGWKCHIGLVSLLTHPDRRGIGLSKVLVDHLVRIAQHCGLVKLEAEFNGERDIAIGELAKIGFTELMRLPSYVRDLEQKDHDYVLMGMDIATPEEYAAAL